MFGRTYPRVHAAMDAAQTTLQSNHRMYFHDDLNLEKTIVIENSIEAGWCFYYHVELDGISDEVGQQDSVATLIDRLLTGRVPFYLSSDGLLTRIAAVGFRQVNGWPPGIVPPALSYEFK